MGFETTACIHIANGVSTVISISKSTELLHIHSSYAPSNCGRTAVLSPLSAFISLHSFPLSSISLIAVTVEWWWLVSFMAAVAGLSWGDTEGPGWAGEPLKAHPGCFYLFIMPQFELGDQSPRHWQGTLLGENPFCFLLPRDVNSLLNPMTKSVHRISAVAGTDGWQDLIISRSTECKTIMWGWREHCCWRSPTFF